MSRGSFTPRSVSECGVQGPACTVLYACMHETRSRTFDREIKEMEMEMDKKGVGGVRDDV